MYRIYGSWDDHDIYLTARSTYVAHVFEWVKIGKCHLMAENLLGMSKWTDDLCL